MKTKHLFTAFSFFMIVFLVSGCAKPLEDQVNGTWVNETVSWTIDMEKKIHRGVDWGQEFSHKISNVLAQDRQVAFTWEDGQKITCAFLPDGRMEVMGSGSLDKMEENISPMYLTSYNFIKGHDLVKHLTGEWHNPLFSYTFDIDADQLSIKTFGQTNVLTSKFFIDKTEDNVINMSLDSPKTEGIIYFINAHQIVSSLNPIKIPLVFTQSDPSDEKKESETTNSTVTDE